MTPITKTQDIPGYTYGSAEITPSPLSLHDLELLKETMHFTVEDEKYLRLAGEVLADQVENVLDVWFHFMGSQPHLAWFFSGPDGNPDPQYMAAVRRRFGQWILDTCNRAYDQQWLNYQHEIGLRHTRAKKNQTDHIASQAPLINLRYILALIYPVTATIRSFLARKDHSAEDVERMYQAWFKSVVLQVTLWSQPFVKEGDF